MRATQVLFGGQTMGVKGIVKSSVLSTKPYNFYIKFFPLLQIWKFFSRIKI